jgi:hypothetical protein
MCGGSLLKEKAKEKQENIKKGKRPKRPFFISDEKPCVE